MRKLSNATNTLASVLTEAASPRFDARPLLRAHKKLFAALDAAEAAAREVASFPADVRSYGASGGEIEEDVEQAMLSIWNTLHADSEQASTVRWS